MAILKWKVVYAVVLCLLLSGCQNQQKQYDLNDRENYIEAIWGSDDRVIIQDNTLMSESTKENWKPHKVQYWDIDRDSDQNLCKINIEHTALFGEKSDEKGIVGWKFQKEDCVKLSFEVENNLYGYDVDKIFFVGYLSNGEKTDVPYTYEDNIFEVSIMIPKNGEYCFYIENASSEFLDIKNLSIIKA